PNFSAGSRRTPRSAARVVKRIAAGVPVPSPRVKVRPPALVTRRFPVRTNLPNISRSNRSIGRLLRARPFLPLRAPFSGYRHRPEPRLWSVVSAPLARIKTKPLDRRNAFGLIGQGHGALCCRPRPYPLLAKNCQQKSG